MQNLKKEITVDSKIENIDALTAFVEKELEPFEPSMKAQMQINVAIDELFSNVVHYSGVEDDARSGSRGRRAFG